MFSKFASEISLPVDVAQHSYIPLFQLYVRSFTYVDRRGLARTSAAVSALIGAFGAAGVFSHWQPRGSGLADNAMHRSLFYQALNPQWVRRCRQLLIGVALNFFLVSGSAV